MGESYLGDICFLQHCPLLIANGLILPWRCCSGSSSAVQVSPRFDPAVNIILKSNLLGKHKGMKDGNLIFGRDFLPVKKWLFSAPGARLGWGHHPHPLSACLVTLRLEKAPGLSGGGSPSHRTFVFANRYTMQFIFKILSIKTVLITDSRSICCNYSRL